MTRVETRLVIFFFFQFYCAEELSSFDAHAIHTGVRRGGVAGMA